MNEAPIAARYCVIGAGGFARQLLLPLEAMVADGLLPDRVVFAVEGAQSGQTFGGFDVIDVSQIGADDAFCLAFADGARRRIVAAELAATGARPFSILAPTARVSRHARIGDGAAICDFSVIEPDVQIGVDFQCNVRAFIAHECAIGDHVTIGPGAICCGNVAIGDGAYIGAGAIIRQGVSGRPTRIGAGATVGMGAVVIGDVADGAVVVGNPARPMARTGE